MVSSVVVIVLVIIRPRGRIDLVFLILDVDGDIVFRLPRSRCVAEGV